MNKHMFSLALAAVSLSVINIAFAADVNGRIKGTVTDVAGAEIPNAGVVAINEATGIKYTTVSGPSGVYNFTQLPIGRYTITVTREGFKQFAASGITINIDQEYVEPVTLAVGSAAETISVQADAVQVDSTNIQLSNIVTGAQIVELPLIGRQFTQLEQLLPGVQASSDRFGSYSANGAQTQQSSFLINGTDSNDLPLNTITLQPSVDALAEFNLVTSSLNPEYSRNSGAIVSATIKSGTNHLHGSAFEFYRDTFLNTPNYFQKNTSSAGIVTANTPKYHQNLFGGTLGGPVLRDRLFFFGSYQGLRARQPQTTNANLVFSAAQLGGDFSAIALSQTRTIPAGITIPGCVTGQTYQSCFKGNQVPIADFNPISAALIKSFVPAATSGTNQYNYTGSTTAVQDQGIGRLDFNIDSADQVWFLAMLQHAPTLNTIPFSGATVPGFGDGSSSEVRQYAVDYIHQFGGTAINDFSVHYNRFNFGSGTPQQVSQPSSYGFGITPADASAAGLPTIGVNGYFTLGSSSNGPQPRIDQTYQLDDNFSKVLGRHAFKFGYDGRKFQVSNRFDARNSGSYGFTNSNVLGTGNALLDFALGIPNSYGQSTQGLIIANAFENYVYAQDTFRATQQLTLTFGVGYQVDTALHNRQYAGKGVTCYINGQQSTVFPNAPKGLNYPGDPGCNDATGSTTFYKNVGPRLGFAYAPNLGSLSGGAGKLSIRGGFGLYYNRSEEETSLNNLNEPPYGLSSIGALDYASGKPAFGNPYINLATGTQPGPNPFPVAAPQPGKPANFPAAITGGLSQYDPAFRSPYAMNYNLTIEREFPSQIVGRASYVGSLARRNQTVIEANNITQAGHDACLADPACIANADSQIFLYPSHSRFGNGNIFPSVGFVQSEGSANYNSLQLSATKGVTHGLSFQLSYTLSHSLDNASSYENAGYGGSVRGYNQFNPQLNYGSSAFDARHRFVFSPVYVIPARKGGNTLVNLATTGWEVSGIQTVATGFPYDISYGGGVSYSLYCSANYEFYACPDIPNQTGPIQRIDPRLKGTAIHSQWFGTTNFSDEVNGSFGNIGRNKYHGPGTIRTDVQLSKNLNLFPGSEGVRYIQLRIESYNVFNHTNFNNPDGNINNPTFGQITSAGSGRQTQLGGKVYF